MNLNWRVVKMVINSFGLESDSYDSTIQIQILIL